MIDEEKKYEVPDLPAMEAAEYVYIVQAHASEAMGEFLRRKLGIVHVNIAAIIELVDGMTEYVDAVELVGPSRHTHSDIEGRGAPRCRACAVEAARMKLSELVDRIEVRAVGEDIDVALGKIAALAEKLYPMPEQTEKKS